MKYLKYIIVMAFLVGCSPDYPLVISSKQNIDGKCYYTLHGASDAFNAPCDFKDVGDTLQ